VFGSLDWSLFLFRLGRITVRAHWTLLAYVIFDVVRALHGGLPLWWAPVLLVIIFLSVLLHELGHALAARLVGGRCPVIILWMLGGLAECEHPMRPAPTFLVAATGPLVNALLWGVCWAVLAQVPGLPPVAGFLIGYAQFFNGMVCLVNLVPSLPLDGGHMLLATLWSAAGLRRGARWTAMTGLAAAVGLFTYAAWSGGFGLMLLSLWLFATNVQALAAMRQGESLVFGVDLGYDAGRGGWLARWTRRRQQRAAARVEREEASEQEVLDRLLAKVSEHGLPSLTAGERAQLERISRRQRERQHAG
jgi:Zn-dependent protease